MAEYIKRTEVMKICREYSKHCFNSNDAYGQDIADRIEIDVIKMPTADVVEVVHGKWLKNNTECSVCKSLNPTMYLNEYELEYKALPLPHCPHCCAKMDGGKEE